MVSIVLHSQYLCTDFTTLLSFNQCCGGSLHGPQCHCLGSLCTARLCSSIRICRVLFDSPVYTWSQLLHKIWYTTPLLLLSGRRDFLLSGFLSGCVLRWRWSKCPEGQVSSQIFHSSYAHRGCARSSVALLTGSPLLVEGERTVLGELRRSLLQVLGETH